MIVVDTTVLVYALGADHPQQEPCRALVRAIGDARIEATTTVEVVQEFLHVRARRRGRAEAADRAAQFATLLSPLLAPTADDLLRGLALYRTHERVGAFDAVLAAATIGRGAAALVSADVAFSDVPGLRHVVPGTAALDAMIGAV